MKYKIEKNDHEEHRSKVGASSCFPTDSLNPDQQETTLDSLIEPWPH